MGEHDGLSAFGEEVVAEMNRLGIMVDVSHISKAAMLDAIAVSQAPVIGSHSSARGHVDHPRNMDDEQLLALRDNGGVVQTVAFRNYVKGDGPEKQQAIQALRGEMGVTGRGRGALAELTDEQRAEYDRRMQEIEDQWPSASVSDFVDHIDYMVDLIGIDHVGISSDFDGGGGVTGWNDASETFNVTLELVQRATRKKKSPSCGAGIRSGSGERSSKSPPSFKAVSKAERRRSVHPSGCRTEVPAPAFSSPALSYSTLVER